MRKSTHVGQSPGLDLFYLLTKLQYSPRYRKGHFITLGSLILAMITVAANIIYVKWENAKRQRGERDYRLNGHSDQWLGHRHPQFRYVV